jgi:hypothetical protein
MASYEAARVAERREKTAGRMFMRKLIALGAVTGSILAAGPSFAQISAEHIQAGTLTCDISGGIGFIIGSQKALNCSFVPTLPGPPEFYSGVINKLGVDLGGTREGVMVWAVYAPTTRGGGLPRRDLRRCFRGSHGGRRHRRQRFGRRLITHGRAAAALGSTADRDQRRSRRRRDRAELRALMSVWMPHLSAIGRRGALRH